MLRTRNQRTTTANISRTCRTVPFSTAADLIRLRTQNRQHLISQLRRIIPFLRRSFHINRSTIFRQFTNNRNITVQHLSDRNLTVLQPDRNLTVPQPDQNLSLIARQSGRRLTGHHQLIVRIILFRLHLTINPGRLSRLQPRT